MPTPGAPPPEPYRPPPPEPVSGYHETVDAEVWAQRQHTQEMIDRSERIQDGLDAHRQAIESKEAAERDMERESARRRSPETSRQIDPKTGEWIESKQEAREQDRKRRKDRGRDR